MIVGVTSTPWALLLARHDSLVDILFLRRVDAHQSLDRLDHPLGVANEKTVDLFRRQVLDRAGEQAREVENLAVRPAHGREAVAIHENIRQPGVDAALVVALVFYHLLL